MQCMLLCCTLIKNKIYAIEAYKVSRFFFLVNSHSCRIQFCGLFCLFVAFG